MVGACSAAGAPHELAGFGLWSVMKLEGQIVGGASEYCMVVGLGVAWKPEAVAAREEGEGGRGEGERGREEGRGKRKETTSNAVLITL